MARRAAARERKVAVRMERKERSKAIVVPAVSGDTKAKIVGRSWQVWTRPVQRKSQRIKFQDCLLQIFRKAPATRRGRSAWRN